MQLFLMGMLMKEIFCFVLSLIFMSQAHASSNDQNFTPIKMYPDVIYGIDNRLDIFESSDSLMKKMARSTAAQILNDKLIVESDSYIVKAPTLAEDGKCMSERFSHQKIAANCSAFLISADTLVTAGHCIEKTADCQDHVWVFDYANTSEEKTNFIFSKDQVYHCVKVIAREKDYTTLNDFAVIKLDRPVPGRTPFQYRKKGKVADDAVLTVLGYPSGLPLKITTGANMRDNTNPVFFQTNADTYGGNSGSAVVDSRTAIVEGVLVRGDEDYDQKESERCQKSVRRDYYGGRGEDATRITNIEAIQ